MSRYFLAFCLLFSSAVESIGHADVIFSIAKFTPGNIPFESLTTFEVFARTDAGTQAFLLLSFDLVLDNTTGAGGQLTNPTESFLSGGWAIIDPYTALYDGLSPGAFNTLTTTNSLLGRITLTTANPGAVAGTYTMRLSLVDVTDSSGARVNASAAPPLSYSIGLAVPEPSSMALVCVLGLGAAWRYRRRVVSSPNFGRLD